MNINELKEKCKNCIRKDSIKNLLSKDEIDFICNYYRFNDDFSLYLLLQEIKNIPFKLYCPTCNKKLTEVQIRSNIKHSTDFYCSKKCNINYKNIDYKSRQQKIEKTNLEKYGVKNVSEIQEVKEKISTKVKKSANSALQLRKETNLKRYGVEHVLRCREIKELQEFSMLERYGDKYAFRIEEFKQKASNTCMFRYGVPWSTYLIENNIFRSKLEYEVIDFIKSICNDLIIHSDRKLLSGVELDLYIPSKKLAIEIDGVYWHCNKFKDKNYHMEKTELCESKGIQLLHIFDIEWNDRNKQKIWKSVIKHKLGLTKNKIYARKCKVVEIDRQTAFDFCEQNHLQGGIKGPINLGLFYEGNLVQVAVISTPRFNKNYKYELLRLCSKLDTTVIGGASKLLKNYSSLISYANRRWSVGNVYNQSGFKLLSISSPNYFYLVNGKLESRNGWQKHKLKNKLNVFDENLTEQENMKLNGINWIYDCGNITFYK